MNRTDESDDLPVYQDTGLQDHISKLKIEIEECKKNTIDASE